MWISLRFPNLKPEHLTFFCSQQRTALHHCMKKGDA